MLSHRLAEGQQEPDVDRQCQGVAATFSQSFSHDCAMDSSGIHLRGVNSRAVSQWIVRNHGWAEVVHCIRPNIMSGGDQGKPLQHQRPIA
jgi:hypothetical protein